MQKSISHLLISLALCSVISCSPKTGTNSYSSTIAPEITPPSEETAISSPAPNSYDINNDLEETEETKPVIYALDEPVDDKAIAFAENITKHLCQSEWVPVLTNDTSEKVKARFHSAIKEKSLVAPNHNVFVSINVEGIDENTDTEYKDVVWLELKKDGNEYKLEKMIHTEGSDDVLDKLNDTEIKEYSMFVWDYKNKNFVYYDETTDPIIPIKASAEGKAAAQQTAKAEKNGADTQDTVKASPNSQAAQQTANNTSN